MAFFVESDEIIESKTELDSNLSSNRKLFLHNDDHNSFDDVILALVLVLQFTVEQSNQIALIVHHKGKYCIKEGDKAYINDLKHNLEILNLTVTTE